MLIETLIETPNNLLNLAPLVDPVSPTYDGPGAAAANKFLGQIAGTLLIVAVIAVVICGGFIAGGHFTRNSEMARKGLIGLVWGVIGSAVIIGASSFINWGQGLTLF